LEPSIFYLSFGEAVVAGKLLGWKRTPLAFIRLILYWLV
jgi:hypothetical protein